MRHHPRRKLEAAGPARASAAFGRATAAAAPILRQQRQPPQLRGSADGDPKVPLQRLQASEAASRDRRVRLPQVRRATAPHVLE
jgi:hypothetical protein